MKKMRLFSIGMLIPIEVKELLLPMKITIVFLLLFMLQGRAETSAQTVTLSVKNKTLKDVLNAVKSQTGYSILLTAEVEENSNPISIAAKDMPLNQFMLQILSNQHASYSINEKTIFIKPEKLTELDVLENIVNLNIQQFEIRGLVRDTDGKPMSGVSVRAKIANRGTVTDELGVFTLRVNKGGTLVFNHVGYKTQEFKIQNENPVNITMRTTDTEVQEVVVMGYGTIDKPELTGSVSSVKIGENNENKVVNVVEALQGKIAGVNILNNTGEPGSGMTFNIRGMTSITGSNQPLIVLDGVPIESDHSATSAGMSIDWQTQAPPLDPLASINPTDIESIDILKDASATAIYGSRGANGVVLITTKRGKSTDGRDKISYNYRSDFSNLPKIIPMVNAEEYMLYRNEASMNDGGAPLYVDSTIFINKEKFKDIVWQEMIYRTAKSQEHQLTSSGNMGKGTYRLSANYSDFQSIVRKAGFQRGGARINFDRDISDRLSLNFGANLSMTYRKYGAQSNAQGAFSSSAVIGAIASQPIRTPYNDDGDLDLEYANNPVLVTEVLKDHTSSQTIISNLDLEYKIFKGFTYKVKGAINQITSNRKVYWPRGTVQGNSYGGSATRADNNNSNYLIDHIFTYRNRINKIHNINAVAGYSYQKWFRSGSSITSTGFPTDHLGYENFALAELPGTTFTTNKNRSLQSAFGRVNYAFDSRYLLTLTGRYDGASRLAPGNKWDFFPSIGLGWNLSNEKFFKENVKAINNMKFRGSYGIAGSENIAIGATQGSYSIDRVIIGSKIVSGFNYASFQNSLLGWETTETFNLGFDLGLLNDRITLTADVYKKTTTDLLINLAIPASSTFRSYSTNTGKVTNRGLDVEASFNIMKKKDFDWTAYGNFTITRNKVLDMGESSIIYGGTYLYGGNSNLNQSLQVAKVGESISSFWGYRTGGIYQNPLEIELDPNIMNDPNKASVRPGDIRFIDMNGDGVITDLDKTVIGKPNPDFSMGFGSNFTYKRWSASFAFLGNFGQQMINLNQWLIGSLTNIGTYSVSQDAWNNRWQGEGTSNKYPRATARNNRFGNRFPDYMVEDASFVRLQSVNIGYNFNMSRILKSSSLRVYASGTNLFTITDYTGYDPNINSHGNFPLMSGTDYGTLPQSRTFSLGVVFGY